MQLTAFLTYDLAIVTPFTVYFGSGRKPFRLSGDGLSLVFGSVVNLIGCFGSCNDSLGASCFSHVFYSE